jgi:Glycosyl transferase family 2
MRILITFLCFCLSMGSYLSAYSSVSVIIPCTYKHFYLLPELLGALESQSMTPDEVVISLSQASLVEEEKQKALLSQDYSFELKMVCCDQPQYAGINRNVAAQHSSGDILITQDADDLPHPQRIEIICYVLKKTRAKHLLHQWYPSDAMIEEMTPQAKSTLPQWVERYDHFKKLPYISIKSFNLLSKQHYVHNGNIAILREVFNSVGWSGDKKAQDVKYNRSVIFAFKKSIFIKAPLVIYRNELSSHN